MNTKTETPAFCSLSSVLEIASLLMLPEQEREAPSLKARFLPVEVPSLPDFYDEPWLCYQAP